MNLKELWEKKSLEYKKRKELAEKEKKKRIKEEKLKRKEKMNDTLKDIEEDQKFKDTVDRIRVNTYTKKMVAIIIGVSLLDLQLTYILAFIGRDQIAESLSDKICTTILGVAFVYMVRAYFDSKAEHKNLDKNIKSELEEGLTYKIKNILSNADLDIDTSDLFNNSNDEEQNYNTDNEVIGSGLHINIENDDTEDTGGLVG